MCGIAGIHIKNPAATTDEGVERFANELLLEIESRGRHATGFVAVNRVGEVTLDKAAIAASDFIGERESFPTDVQTVLLHTRFKTKGDQSEMGNNHPVSYNTCFTTHNGGIWNDDALFASEKLKRNYQVDTEIIPALLDKYGIDNEENIRIALEKFEGAMAIAAIDPVRNPKRLVLARGESSPLYVFENGNVILWASTHKAIKTAWGKILGTPPQDARIKFLPTGQFLVVDDDQTSSKYDFKIPKFVSNYSRRHQSTAITSGKAKLFRRPWDSQGPFNARNDFDQALQAFRKESGGVRMWSKRPTYDNETFADVKGTIQWHNCICGTSVLREDMTSHANYGAICKDCYHVILEAWRAKTNHPLAEKVPTKKADEKEAVTISEKDQLHLENWVRTERLFHRYALSDLSDFSGISISALDFLLFRTQTVASDFGAAMVATKYNLRKVYDELMGELKEELGSEVINEAEVEKATSLEDAQKAADELMLPWEAFMFKAGGSNGNEVVHYVCTDHGEVFEFGDGCHSCDDAIEAVTEAVTEDNNSDAWPGEDALDKSMGWCGGDPERGSEDTPGAGIKVFADESLDAPPRTICAGCKTMRRADLLEDPCPVCKLNERGIPAKEKITVTECSCKQTRNRKCKRQLEFVLTGGIFSQLGFCRPHWTRCSDGKCNRDPHFTALDGRRYCHEHQRGKQGIHDNAQLQGGVVLLEVK